MVSSPSNASNTSSVTTSPWRDYPPPPQQQHDQPQSSPLAAPASSFGPAPDAALFLGKSPLEPMPEAPAAPDYTDTASNNSSTATATATATATTRSKTASPANGFPLHPSSFFDDSNGDDDDKDAFGGSGGAAGGVRGGGRAAMSVGVSGAASGSVRDFTASRAASSSRRMTERQRSGFGPAGSGGGYIGGLG